MLRVLIADDEQKVCQLIEKLIDWDGLGLSCVGEVHDGIEALAAIKEKKPDIVITDIRMPGYDGLELIDKSKELDQEIEFVIISGYRHFEYAQSALKYGVRDYLLKPIRKTELTEALKKISERRKRESDKLTHEEKTILTMKNDEKQLRSMFMSKLLHRELRQDSEPMDIPGVNERYHMHWHEGEYAIIIVKHDGNVLLDKKTMDYIKDKELSLVQALFGKCTYEYDTCVENTRLYLIINYSAENKMAIHKSAKELLDQVIIQVNVVGNINVTVAKGYSVLTLSQIYKSLKCAEALIEDRLITGTEKLMEGIPRENVGYTDFEAFSMFNRRINTAFESMKIDEVRAAIMALKAELMAVNGISGHEILQMTREISNLYLLFLKNNRMLPEPGFMDDMVEATELCHDADELFSVLSARLCISYHNTAVNKLLEEDRPVRVTKQYIKDHYNSNLSLDEVSTAAGLTSTYLSTIFKKETGRTFVEYLSDTRIEAAKKLLKETDKPVAEICEEVGYSDVKYFSRLFTKNAGIKPSEYRKLYA